MSETSGQQPSHSHALSWVLGITAALLLYVLSWGPVIYLNETHVLPDPLPHWVNALYYPLFLLCEFTPLGKPIDAYLHWWLQLGNKP